MDSRYENGVPMGIESSLSGAEAEEYFEEITTFREIYQH